RSRKLLGCNRSSQTQKPREEIDNARKEKLQKSSDRNPGTQEIQQARKSKRRARPAFAIRSRPGHWEQWTERWLLKKVLRRLHEKGGCAQHLPFFGWPVQKRRGTHS